jgi:hypothetical protein
MISVIVPTMWRYTPFLSFLADLVKVDVVGEVIIINNDINYTPNVNVLVHPKIKLVNCSRNIYVNPAWNLGARLSQFDKLCFLNDDISVDLKLFYKIDEFLTSDVGTIGIVEGNTAMGQPPFVDGTIDFVQWTGQFMYGFGTLFFVHKSNWIPIPDGLKVYYGDNWVFDSQLFSNKKNNYMITNTLVHHEHSQTSKSLSISEFYEPETMIFNEAIAKLKAPPTMTNFLEEEYEKFSNISYRDFYLHMPVLRSLVKECQHVTEFGVSEGQSTRAILVEPVIVRSYDLYLHASIINLFSVAQTLGHDARCSTANTLEIEIEETDLLFIDTLHTYKQLKAELNLHHHKVKKYLVMHDTHTFATVGECVEPDVGLIPAVLEFLSEHPEWRVKSHTTVCNGLTVLERIA